jgi:hypothetical protein
LGFRGDEQFHAMDEQNLTIAPVESSTGVNAEFVDFHGLKNIFGIGRSLGYFLIQRGDITSKVLRHPGRIKGKRLIVAESVREFLAKQPSDVDPRLSALNRRAQKVSAQKKKAAKTGVVTEAE